ncbi:MAG: glycosyltransferase [Phycisphaerae bacterium]
MPKKTADNTRSRRSTTRINGNPMLFEIAWEVCQQVGGIYTVIRSKVPFTVDQRGSAYCLVGPYNRATTPLEFEEATPTGVLAKVFKHLEDRGIVARYGHWLITGRPRVILLEPESAMDRLAEIKYLLWEHHDIPLPEGDDLLNRSLAFGWCVQQLFAAIQEAGAYRNRPIITHFHEWLSASAIPEMRRKKLPYHIVFTTHATQLGRYVATNDAWFYDHLPFIDWQGDSKRFNVEPQVRLERAAAHGAHLFTTVSDITSEECQHLLGRTPDVVTPNGLNIERFVAMHEFQNLHRMYKEQIHEFVMGQFFPSYSFDLDNTIYLFTSGRYEYRNKGFDMTIEAAARLNQRLKQEGPAGKTVVLFLVTRRPYRSVIPEVLQRQAMMAELRKTCNSIRDELGDRLFHSAAGGELPKLDTLISDTSRMRLLRMIHALQRENLPVIVTHDLWDSGRDEVLCQVRNCNLINRQEDPVKIVYHPEFASASDPLLGLDYDQFVRGCHVGVFPSYYEPWGYTPLECVAHGIPAVTSDLSGFGTYVQKHFPEYHKHGIFVVGRRHQDYNTATDQLANWLYRFVHMGRRERIALRNQVENSADHFDWHNVGQYYTDAYQRVTAIDPTE